ncbi:hypothetical protein IW492_01790 [Enterococcus sp. BWB1-3]|uniref:hypothetical protein n=1 Tax=Enterococcus sp. BWB1-3 TaxID=2787713 RepID=UPI00192446C4|nr:hypothetical protein [Enterococcus sp. BWB1-3]MBL1227960.1 hypothetical protein [Enterococcus sp. BWB1-3]
MNRYEEKAGKMKDHLTAHPKDYQTVIQLFKMESEAIAYEQRQKQLLMQREIARYRKAGETNGK